MTGEWWGREERCPAVLGFLGLDERQEAAYRLLIGAGAVTAGELASRLGFPEQDVAHLLRDLERLGLAASAPGRAGRFLAAPPALALGAVLTQRRHELKEAELTVAALAEEFRAANATLPGSDLLEVVTGADSVRHRFQQLQLGAEREVLALISGAPEVVDGADNAAEPQAVSRGVVYRVVVERAVLDMPGGLSQLAEALERREQVRVVERIPTRRVIADRRSALVPLYRAAGGGGEVGAVLARSEGLVEALTALFEGVWEQAVPVRLTASGVELWSEAEPDDTDLRILSLLLVGLTDASVAKQLDVGLRTVQRRVKRMMDLAGVTTRMQLGWQAYERGWVAREHDRRDRTASSEE
jgi:sugar-specific transcriptional regulator TrmB